MTAFNGWLAANAGEPRDAAQSAEWLQGYDGFHTGAAMEAKRQADVTAAREAHRKNPDNIFTTRAIKARIRARKSHSGTPRTIG